MNPSPRSESDLSVCFAKIISFFLKTKTREEKNQAHLLLLIAEINAFCVTFRLLQKQRWWWWWWWRRRMSRPWLLVFLVLLIILTSQFEWKQQFGNDIEASPGDSHNQKRYNLGQQEPVKEKIILSQEKNIQKLNELVQRLREQLIQCRNQNYVVNDTSTTLTEGSNELDHQDSLDD